MVDRYYSSFADFICSLRVNVFKDILEFLSITDVVQLGVVNRDSILKYLDGEILRYFLERLLAESSTGSGNLHNLPINLIRRAGFPVLYYNQEALMKNTMEMYLKSENGRLYGITVYYHQLPQVYSEILPFIQPQRVIQNADLANDAMAMYDCLPPFTTNVKDKSGQPSFRLSCIAYFEVSFLRNPHPNNYLNNNNLDALNSNEVVDEYYFGLASSYQEIEKCLAGIDECSFVYRHNGRMMYSKKTFAFDCYYKFNPGDSVGCGICYPPLASSNGQVFFTRNGEVVHTEDLSSPDYLSMSWFPFAVCNPSYTAKFNFGRMEPWKFNAHLYEECRMKQLKTDSYDQILAVQDQMILSNSFLFTNSVLSFQAKLLYRYFFKYLASISTSSSSTNISPSTSQKFSIQLKKSERRQPPPFNGNSSAPALYKSNAPGGSPPLLISAYLMKEQHSDDYLSNDEEEEEEEDDDVDVMLSTSVHHNEPFLSFGSSTSPTTLQLQSALKTSHLYKINSNSLSPDDSNTRERNKPTVAVNFAANVNTNEKADSAGSRFFLNNNSSTANNPAPKNEWDEEFEDVSMAVELSSVDSAAVNEMRDFGISSLYPADSGKIRGRKAERQQESKFVRNDGSSVSSFPDFIGGLPLSSIPSSSSIAGKDYASLSDARLADNFLHHPSQLSASFPSSNNQAAPDENDSEKSFATSLLVEVASLGEDGSYLGYGGFPEQEDFMEDEEYIRGRLSKTEDTHLYYNGHDSDGGCGARWNSRQDQTQSDMMSMSNHPNMMNNNEGMNSNRKKRKRGVEPPPSSLSPGGSSSTFSRKKPHKVPKVTSETPIHHASHALPASSMDVAVRSAYSLSAFPLRSSGMSLNDGEDGYDGASERGGRYEFDTIDDYTTDTELLRIGSHDADDLARELGDDGELSETKNERRDSLASTQFSVPLPPSQVSSQGRRSSSDGKNMSPSSSSSVNTNACQVPLPPVHSRPKPRVRKPKK